LSIATADPREDVQLDNPEEGRLVPRAQRTGVGRLRADLGREEKRFLLGGHESGSGVHGVDGVPARAEGPQHFLPGGE
jgi:hypothetical protein